MKIVCNWIKFKKEKQHSHILIFIFFFLTFPVLYDASGISKAGGVFKTKLEYRKENNNFEEGSTSFAAIYFFIKLFHLGWENK